MTRPQFSITALLALTALVAIALVASLPFTPHFRYNAIATSTILPKSPNTLPGYDMLVTNIGRSPVWLASSSGTTLHCACANTPVYYSGGRYEYSIDVNALTKRAVDVQWIRLGRNESTKIRVGPSLKIPQIIGLAVRDWRGRDLQAWSEPYTPPSL